MKPDYPTRADYRFIKKILDMHYSSKVEYRATEFEKLSNVFLKAGGSWEALFKGSTKDVSLMKKIVKIAVKKKFLTPSKKLY